MSFLGLIWLYDEVLTCFNYRGSRQIWLKRKNTTSKGELVNGFHIMGLLGRDDLCLQDNPAS